MKIGKLIIKNYKIYKDITIHFNDNINIFVGENDSGKTTILESLSIALTGRLNGNSILARLNLDWFNYDVRKEYEQSLATVEPCDCPAIIIEAYFSQSDVSNNCFNKFKGTNNSLREDAIGVKVEIKFNDEYSDTYKQLLRDNRISYIPVELYKVEFRSFSNPNYYINEIAKKVAFIDSTKKDYGKVLNRFVSNSISEYLTDQEKTDLRIAYRGNRQMFNQSDAVKSLNSKVQSKSGFRNKVLSVNLRENEIDSWKNEMSLSLDEIPFENMGFGTQNMFKTEMFVQQNSDVDILIIEEPENNLSFTNMSILISKLSENENKQLFISTHSSFVANRLGLNHLNLVANKETKSFKDLSEDTYRYFLKLPGYNTLRLLLANKIILVEGPTDELIVQRAYLDNHNKLPIEDGIDVMSIAGVAFKRYCELAKLIDKEITVLTDNDGNIGKLRENYDEYKGIVKLLFEENEELTTIEPSVLAANNGEIEKFCRIIYNGNSKTINDAANLCNFMKNNKVEWSMRVFLSEEQINYPDYINEAIGRIADE